MKFIAYLKPTILLYVIMLHINMHSQIVSTFAGSGNAGSTNGTGIAAEFKGSIGIAIDGSGNVYVADSENFKIRKITPAGVVTTFAGSGVAGSVNGTGTAASFSHCGGLAIDISGNIYVAEYESHKIRKITPTGVVTTLAGSGIGGSADGIGTAASFFHPMAVAVDLSGNVYVADWSTNKIRKITPSGVVTTLAGSGATGAADGIGSSASFNMPEGLVVDGIGNVYVADTYNHIIRKITPSGVVTTFAGSGTNASVNGNGTSASFKGPRAITLDNSGNFYISEFRKIRKVTSSGVVTDFVGNGSYGCTDGIGISATTDLVKGITTNSTGELIYFSETNFNKIRRVLSCNSTAPQSPVATITQPTTLTPTGVITITSPIGAFEYSIDNINYQSSTVFNNVTPGNYNVTSRKSASIGCVSISTNLTVNVAPSQSGSMKIACGYFHSLAICNDGTVQTWGVNSYGQLGNGTNINSKIPVQVNSLTGITDVKSGSEHCLALKNDGTVWAWGRNFYGQLGNGNTNNSNVPVNATGLTNITAISAGYQNSFALKSDGTIWAWGYNTSGQLGNGTNANSSVPVQIISLTGIIAISGGNHHTIALKNDGTVWAWGDSPSYQLGNGTNIASYTPTQVSNLTGIIKIEAGDYNSFAIKNDGTVWAWGSNYWGAYGNGTTADGTTPVQITALTGITSIIAAARHSLAIKSDGTVISWGYNYNNQLGDGTAIDSYFPVPVSLLNSITSIAGFTDHSIALKSDGTIWSWGSNFLGQLGDGTLINRSIPVQVNNLCSNAIGISEYTEDNLMSIYPNPTTGIFQIKSDLPTSDANIKVYNTHGQTIYESAQFVEEIDLSNQPKGVYFLQIKSQEGIINKKLILQ
jgi:alpha-tubulin suppressor-like RCC1 family protein